MSNRLKRLTKYNELLLELTPETPFACYTWCCYENNKGVSVAGVGFNVSRTLSAARFSVTGIPIFGVYHHKELEIVWSGKNPELGKIKRIPYDGAPAKLVEDPTQ